jgi:hypothetical protein
LLLLSCQDGPKAAFNEEFVMADQRKAIPFEDIVGFYQLDNDSKKRYNISQETNLTLDIKLNKNFVANNYLDSKTWKLNNKELRSFFYYYSGNDGTSLSCPVLTNGGVDIYYRKKDGVLTLYVYTPSLKGQENGDYLRYIKVKK